MKKGNVISAVLGLLAGLVIGFVVANSINKSAYEKQPATLPSAATPNSNPPLPKDHPPIGTTSGDGPPNAQGAPRPEVAVAIEKAKASRRITRLR